MKCLLVIGAKFWQLDVHAGTETGAQVAGTGKNVTQVLVPHELVTLLLHQALHLGQPFTEPLEHSFHIPALLHGDDARVVLLVDPHQKVLIVVVPNAAGVRPVAGHPGARQQRRHGLVEEEVVSNKLLLLFVGHSTQRIVLACREIEETY